jgi:nitrogenase-stabilizing/protective protein
MNEDWSKFQKLKEAEEYFVFFQIPYDQKVINVNRLHILKKFSQYIQ